MLGRVRGVSLNGISGNLVEIEADIGVGLPALILIGLPDASLGEAKDRVRSAIANSGIAFPPNRVTVNLSPADLPKQGSGFDLGIAMAIVSAAGIVTVESVETVVMIGELALDGRLRPIAGVLPAVLAAQRSGAKRIFVPTGNLQEAQLVSGIEVIPVSSLSEVIIRCGGNLSEQPVEPIMPPEVTTSEAQQSELADVVGQPEVVDSLIVAAAGKHHLSMVGPPGAGKTMLAERLVGILPDLEEAESIEVTSIASLARAQQTIRLETRPPFIAPHHTATPAAVIGGGGKLIRPGAISLASGGVLFLDEAPEFQSSVLESLRQPLESGRITIHRSASSADFPAKFLLTLAANPCPCGGYGGTNSTCECTPDRRRRYLARLSGPIMDRIDIRLNVNRVSRQKLLVTETPPLTTAVAREMVEMARLARFDRWGAAVPKPGELRSGRFRLGSTITASLDAALDRGAISMRGYDRVLRIAWTVADLDGVTTPGRSQIGKAIFLRQGV